MKRILPHGLFFLLLMGLGFTTQAQVRINEVGYAGVDFMGATKWVELYNAGDSAEDVSELYLCNFPTYSQISTLTILEGAMVIPAGGHLVVAFNALGSGDGEVGLYTSNAFTSAAAMADYMQYGSAGHTRESVAVMAGVWTAGAFVPAAESGATLAYFGSGATPAENWDSGTATPGVTNEVSSVAIERIGDETPTRFALHGNYPNPFNPSTTIHFELANAGQVVLAVYDVLGQQVAELVNGVQSAGVYEVQWDGRDTDGQVAASGVYLYRVTFDGQQSQSRVMTLLK
ncbi:MAG: FlgD immunoglobulin-like domain containing protein [Rhodothermales bacterium]|nr:FlgD immunoglobulin-like domain containing protein [Rhodothermales bacterium]